MLKNLMVLSAFVMLGGCETLNQASQCDPDKNYVISNPEAIGKYKKLLSNNEIKSVYYKNIPTEKCNWDSCVQFDSEKFEFVEKYFDDKYRKGIYKVFITDDLKRSDCLEHDPVSSSLKNKCFYVVKNNDDKIESRYGKLIINMKDSSFTEISDIKEGVSLYKSSRQVYDTGAIGAYGVGHCKVNFDNNKGYKIKIDGVL